MVLLHGLSLDRENSPVGSLRASALQGVRFDSAGDHPKREAERCSLQVGAGSAKGRLQKTVDMVQAWGYTSPRS